VSLVNDFGLNFLFRFFPNHTQKILQKLPQTKPFEPLQEFYPAKTQTSFRVVLLEGCVAKYFFNSTNLATIKVLTENNCDVFVPKNQNCCGSLHNHNGESELANELAFANEKIFSKIKPDFIVTNSAGCGSFLKEFYHKNSPETKVRDICELLVEIGFRKPETKLSLRIAYHDACHLVHGQKITKQPREILQTIDGIELVNFKESDFCCGSAGIYNVLQPELAQQLLDRKITNLPTEKIDFVATGNPGCTLQIQNGLKSYGLDLQVVHPVEILAKSYEGELLQKQN
ncbi:(Fe-S)-binding protein, partial [bacterium]|nr:(Fe-S)-binding protein [bacterium]